MADKVGETVNQLIAKHKRYQRMYQLGGLWSVPELEWMIQRFKSANSKKAAKPFAKKLAKMSRLPLRDYGPFRVRRWVWSHTDIAVLLGV